MKNPYQTTPIKIIKIKKEGANCKLFRLAKNFDFKPGQFIMAGIPGFGEAAFSLCAENEICVRKVGTVTTQMHRLKEGDKLWVRGPYGRGWPIGNAQKQKSKIKIQNYLLVGGGLGIAPLRPLILMKDKLFSREVRFFIFYGIRQEKDLLFRSEHKKWSNLYISIEPKMVTDLFDEVKLPKDITAFLCGPPIMYKFVIQKLKEHGIQDENIYLSLERRMHCGLGVCQHCAIGPKYVCIDGPVFSFKEISKYPF